MMTWRHMYDARLIMYATHVPTFTLAITYINVFVIDHASFQSRVVDKNIPSLKMIKWNPKVIPRIRIFRDIGFSKSSGTQNHLYHREEKWLLVKDGRLLGVDADSRLLKNLNNSRVESWVGVDWMWRVEVGESGVDLKIFRVGVESRLLLRLLHFDS